MKNPNGIGSVIKLAGKRRRPFAVRITVGFSDDGKQKYKYLNYFKTRKEALQYLYTYKKSDVELTEKITVKSLLDLFLEYKKETIALITWKTIESRTAFYRPLFNLDYRELTIEKVQYIFDKSLNKSRLNNKANLSVLNDFINFINKRGYKLENFTNYIDIKGIAKKKKNIFTDEEIKKLWDNIETPEISHTIKITLILLYTGARVNEILKLKKSDIFLDDNFIRTGSKTEKGKNRIIPINKKIKPIFEEFYNLNNDIFFIFDYDAFRYQFKKLMKSFKMTHTIHETRHTFITRMRMVSEEVETIQDIVGHTDTKTLDIYTHKEKNKTKMEELINLLD